MNSSSDKSLRLIFMGTPEFAVPTLQCLINSKHKIVAVYTQPPRPANRGKKETKSPIHMLAEQNNIAVYTPKTLKTEEVQRQFREHKADAAIVVAYGMILPKEILDACPMGCINVHPSKLPRWRGAAPIQHAILAGDKKTAITIMQMDEGLDTGDMLLTKDYDIPENMTAGELHDLLANDAGELVLQTLRGIENKTITPIPQPEKGATYAPKINKKDAAISWNKSAVEIHNQIRALSPYPAAYFSYKGERIKALESKRIKNICFAKAGTVLNDNMSIACGDGSVIRLTKLQRAGKNPLNTDDFLRGFPINKGEILE